MADFLTQDEVDALLRGVTNESGFYYLKDILVESWGKFDGSVNLISGLLLTINIKNNIETFYVTEGGFKDHIEKFNELFKGLSVNNYINCLRDYFENDLDKFDCYIQISALENGPDNKPVININIKAPENKDNKNSNKLIRESILLLGSNLWPKSKIAKKTFHLDAIKNKNFGYDIKSYIESGILEKDIQKSKITNDEKKSKRL